MYQIWLLNAYFHTWHVFNCSELLRNVRRQVRRKVVKTGFIVPNHFTAQPACFVLMSHVCPSRLFEHGRWVSMMACLSHPSLTAPFMQNYACASVAAAQGQVLFWESKEQETPWLLSLASGPIWVSAKSPKRKVTILTAFLDIVGLFNTSLFPVCSGKIVDFT